MGHTRIINNKKATTILYSVVFASRFISVVVLLLLVSLLLQPIARAYAQSDLQLVDESSVDTVVPDVPWDEDKLVTTLASPSSTENSKEDDVSDAANGYISEDVLELGSITSGENAALSDNIGSDSSFLEDSSGEITSVDEAVLNTDISLEELSISLSDEVFTLEDEGGVFTESAVTNVSYADTAFQFGQGACVRVSGGSFYCQENTQNQAELTSNRSDGLYALPDADGDLEIYMQKSGELTQLTFNTTDDSAPYYDTNSDTIVWHRQINERYQIISYDVKTATETQLTFGTVNNMEPTRSGRYTTWQYWGTAWDIVLHDGEKILRVTESDTHDINPHIRNGLVIWNRVHLDGKQTIELYNIKTGEYVSIDGDENGSVSNPRMVVMFESTNQVGDVVTRGYDILTGEFVQLGTLPIPLPERIPEPKDQAEAMVLVYSKSSQKDDQENSDDDLPEGDDDEISDFDLLIVQDNLPPSDVTTTSVSSNLELTLDLRADTVVVEDGQSTDHTLVVSPFIAPEVLGEETNTVE